MNAPTKIKFREMLFRQCGSKCLEWLPVSLHQRFWTKYLKLHCTGFIIKTCNCRERKNIIAHAIGNVSIEFERASQLSSSNLGVT
ncbi:MAG: hypothetical protein RLZ63_354 [Pseudomonadota bacterium]